MWNSQRDWGCAWCFKHVTDTRMRKRCHTQRRRQIWKTASFKSFWGNGPTPRSMWCKQKEVISAAELKCDVLPPARSTQTPVLIWTFWRCSCCCESFWSGEYPAVFFMCERQTLATVWPPLVGRFPELRSENSFSLWKETQSNFWISQQHRTITVNTRPALFSFLLHIVKADPVGLGKITYFLPQQRRNAFPPTVTTDHFHSPLITK